MDGRSRKPRSPRRFLVAGPSAASQPGDPVELAPGEAQHALRVLRMGPGDRALGLDGAGGRYPLEVRAVTGRNLEVALWAPRTQEPAPGAPGARLPRIELGIAWPKKPRAEALVDRLVQLGAARIAPLTGARSAPGAGVGGRARLERVAAEALKQSAGSWLPELPDLVTLEAELERELDGPTYLLDPDAPTSAAAALLETPTAALVRFLIGPEGGFEPEERDRALAAGARPVWIAPRILRIETAAEAACALSGALLGQPPERRADDA